MGLFSKTLDIVLVYKFIAALVTPFNKTQAFKLGIIDDKGKLLKKPSTFKTQAERDAYGYFDRLVFHLKRLLAMVPFGATTIASYAAAMWLISEEIGGDASRTVEDYMRNYLRENYGDFPTPEPPANGAPSKYAVIKRDILNEDGEIIARVGTPVFLNTNTSARIFGVNLFEGKIDKDSPSMLLTKDDVSFIMKEEGEGGNAGGGEGMPANNISGGNIATYPTFMGHRVFKVKQDHFYTSIRGKHPRHRYSRYVGLEEQGEEIRQYGRSNPGAGIILQNEITGEMVFLKRRW